MKWWYVLVLVAGVGIAWWFWGKYGIKTATPVMVVTGSNIEKEVLNLPTQTTIDSKGLSVETAQVVGVVQSWDSSNEILEFSANGKIWKVSVNLANTIIIVNSLKTKMVDLQVTDKTDPNWVGGFCQGDEVVLRLKGEEVIFVMNNGPRPCGFKDK